MKKQHKVLPVLFTLPLLSLLFVSCDVTPSSSSSSETPKETTSSSSEGPTSSKILFLGRDEEEVSAFKKLTKLDQDSSLDFYSYTQEDSDLLNKIENFSDYKQIILSSFDFKDHMDLVTPLSTAVKTGVSLFTIGTGYNSTTFTKTPEEIASLLPVNFAFDAPSSYCFVVDTSSALSTHLGDLKSRLKNFFATLPEDDKVCLITKEDTSGWMSIREKTDWKTKIDGLTASSTWSLAPLATEAKGKLATVNGQSAFILLSASLPSDQDTAKEVITGMKAENYPKNYVNLNNTEKDHVDYLLSLMHATHTHLASYSWEHFDASDTVFPILRFIDTTDIGISTTLEKAEDPSLKGITALSNFEIYSAAAKEGTEVILSQDDIPCYVKGSAENGKVSSFTGSLLARKDGFSQILFDPDDFNSDGARFLRQALADNR